jgi:TP901 family phage tail tape measure protein
MARFSRALATGVTRAGASAAARLGSSLTRTGASLTGFVTVPIVAAGVAATNLAADFETSMAKIQGLAGAGREDVEKFHNQILELSKTLPTSPQELADALYFVVSAGFEGAEAFDVLNQAARLSAAGMGETQVIADALSSVLNAYGHEAITASRASDILAATVREGKAEADAIAPILGRIVPLAAELGVEFEEVGGSLAVLTKVGNDAAISATALRGIFNTILKPSVQTREEWDKMGLSLADVRKELEQGGVLNVLNQFAEIAATDAAALGRLFPNIRAVTGYLGILGKNAQDNTKDFAAVADSLGLADEALKKQSKTANFAAKTALSAIKSAGVSFGEFFLPVVTEFAKKIGALAEGFDKLPDAIKKNIITFSSWVAVLGPGLFLMGKLLSVGAKISSMFITMGKHVPLLGFKQALAATGGVMTPFQKLGAFFAGGLVTTSVIALGTALVDMTGDLGAMDEAVAQVAATTKEAFGTSGAEAIDLSAKAIRQSNAGIVLSAEKVNEVYNQGIFAGEGATGLVDVFRTASEAVAGFIPFLDSTAEKAEAATAEMKALAHVTGAQLRTALIEITGLDLDVADLSQLQGIDALVPRPADILAYNEALTPVNATMGRLVLQLEQLAVKQPDAAASAAVLTGQYHNLSTGVDRAAVSYATHLLKLANIAEAEKDHAKAVALSNAAIRTLTPLAEQATEAYDKHLKKVFDNDRAYNEWGQQIIANSGLFRTQRDTIAESLGIFAQQGVKLKDGTKAMLEGALAANDYEKIVKILGKQLGNLPKNVRTKFDIDVRRANQGLGKTLAELQSVKTVAVEEAQTALEGVADADVAPVIELPGINSRIGEVGALNSALNFLDKQIDIVVTTLFKEEGKPPPGYRGTGTGGPPGRTDVDTNTGTGGGGSGHYGGFIPGLRGGEIDMRLLRGEGILSLKDMRALGGRRGFNALRSALHERGEGGGNVDPVLLRLEVDGKTVSQTVRLHDRNQRLLMTGRRRSG